MAQSRLEKVGTIYSRVRGFLANGAIKEEQVGIRHCFFAVRKTNFYFCFIAKSKMVNFRFFVVTGLVDYAKSVFLI